MWTYKTAHGDVAVTDRWEDIPLAQRTHAVPFTSAPAVAQAPQVPELRLDPYSFGGGVLLGASLALLIARGRRTWIMVALTAIVLVAGMGMYWSFVRRQAGLSSSMLSSPQAIIGDVKDTAATMKAQLGAQQRTLDQIEAGGK